MLGYLFLLNDYPFSETRTHDLCSLGGNYFFLVAICEGGRVGNIVSMSFTTTIKHIPSKKVKNSKWKVFTYTL